MADDLTWSTDKFNFLSKDFYINCGKIIGCRKKDRLIRTGYHTDKLNTVGVLINK